MIISRNPGSNLHNIKYKSNSLDEVTMQVDGRQEEERKKKNGVRYVYPLLKLSSSEALLV